MGGSKFDLKAVLKDFSLIVLLKREQYIKYAATDLSWAQFFSTNDLDEELAGTLFKFADNTNVDGIAVILEDAVQTKFK